MIKLTLRLEGESDLPNGEASIEFDDVDELMEVVDETIETVKKLMEEEEERKLAKAKEAKKASEELFKMLTKKKDVEEDE